MYKVIPTPKFEDDFKFYFKKRKYINIGTNLRNILLDLESGNLVGKAIADIKLPKDEDTYKVRAVNTDTNVGKSNGYRLIYYAIKNDKTIFLLTIYYKKDDNRIPTKEKLIEIIETYCK